MDELFAYLQSLFPFTPELQAALVNRWQKEAHRKHKTILSAGQICDWIGFIEKGMVRVCYDVPGGDERVISFQRAGEVVCAVNSFTGGQVAKISIVSMDETVLRKIRKVELEAVCEKYPSFNIHIRKIIEIQTGLLEEHYLLLTLPARERLEFLRKEQAWMLKDRRIRGYMVAGYLGVDRATFSRWRRGG